MNKAVAIIPARWGSTRFPGKALYPIAGKQLLQRVWTRVQAAWNVDAVVIATDDMRIAEAAFEWGAEVSLTSPKHRSGTDRIAEVARKLRDTAYIINIQGDEALIEPSLIDRFVRELRQNPECEMITAAHPFENSADANSPHQVKVVLDRHGHALYFSRSKIPFSRDSAHPPRYFRHQGIYGYTRDFLLHFVAWKASPLEKAEQLEQLRALENGVTVHVLVTRHGSPGVDTPQDAKALEQKLARAKGKAASR